MTKWIILGLVGFIAIWGGISYIEYNNHEVELYELVNAKFKSNESVFDNMWKSIKQVAQVSDKEKDAFKEMISAYMAPREGNQLDGRGSFMSMLQERYPEMPKLTYTKLADVVLAKRDEFNRTQIELQDICRQYKAFTNKMPAKWFITVRDIEDKCIVVSSNRTKEAFISGEDNDIDIF